MLLTDRDLFLNFEHRMQKIDCDDKFLERIKILRGNI